MRTASINHYNSIFASTACTCIGVLFAAVGITTGLNHRSFVEQAVTTQGIVIDNLQDSTKSSSYYYPLVKFITRSGETIVFESKVGNTSPKYTKGEQVEVLYNPQKPNAAMINTWVNLWFSSVAFSCMGSAAIIFGGALFARFSTQTKSAKNKKLSRSILKIINR
ncbi:hypothetical protein NUACC21_58750 [Scytonema sp. NUACC21]